MSTSQKMTTDKGEKTPAIAPPLVILICIAGAVAAVIAVAAMSRLCRCRRTDAGGDIEVAAWNPNKRNREQDKYMEEVRWRNNAFAWERAKEEHQYRNEYKRGWFKEQVEHHRAVEQAGRIPGQCVSAEEFLTHRDDNPYQELLDLRIGVEQSHQQSRYSPGKNHRNRAGNMLQTTAEEEVPEPAEPAQLLYNQSNTGVRITVNDKSDDIVNQELPPSNKFPPRRSRMFRSSSIYSGDALLPSNHLHMVQSSSNYALKENKAAKARQEIDEWEQSNHPP